LRAVEHRLQIVDEFQTHTLPEEPAALARLARRLGSTAAPVAARRGFEAEYRRVTRGVHEAFSDFFAAPPKARAPAPRIPTYTALKATGFADPDRARENLRLVLEGRPLIPRRAPAPRAPRDIPCPARRVRVSTPTRRSTSSNACRRRTAHGLPEPGGAPELLANLVKLCARGELLTQLLLTQPELLTGLADPATFAEPRRRPAFRGALAPALGPRLTPAERMDRLRRLKQAEELGVTWRMLLGVTDAEKFSREMTALAEAALHG
jgi:glutamate-ammonia-ligase adenylyltransferase